MKFHQKLLIFAIYMTILVSIRSDQKASKFQVASQSKNLKSLANNKNQSKTGNKNKGISTPQEMNIHGEAYNVDDNPGTLAITAGVARAPSPVNIEGLVTPQMVAKIDENPPRPLKGPLESVEELATVNEYYDGSLKLNTVKVKCHIYASREDCIHNSNCGWCGSRNGCVLGNNFGPFEACVRSSYIFAPPVATASMTRHINEHVGGVTATLISAMH